MSSQQHSRLGQILINKGLISAARLGAAIQAQLSNHKRLDEALIEQGLLSKRQLRKALKKQINLRLATTPVAALLSPFQMASADIQRMQPPAAVSRQELPENLRPLIDVEMDNANAQGLNESLEGLFLKAKGSDSLAAMKQLAKLAMLVLDSLEMETSVSDVHYEAGKTQSTLNPGGSVNLCLPNSIGEMRFDNICIAGTPREQMFGSVSLQQIDLSQASLKISLRL